MSVQSIGNVMKRIFKIYSRRIFKNHITILKSGIGEGCKVRGSLSFLKLRHTESKRDIFLKNLDLNYTVVYDIGGYTGVFSMFLAKRIEPNGKVITFEPNPENHLKIIENAKLNNINNIKPFNVALGGKNERKEFAFYKYNSGTGTCDDELKLQFKSSRKKQTIYVDVYSFDDFIENNNLPAPQFVNIDAEGSEYEILLGMTRNLNNFKPALFIEIHGADEKTKIDNIKKIVSFLKSYGYSIFHIESNQEIQASNFQVAKEGHIFAKAL